MNDERREADFDIVEDIPDNRSPIEKLMDNILESLGGLEADMRKTDELARFMGVFDTVLMVRDRLDNGICLINEGTIDSLRTLLEPYTRAENVGVRVAAESVSNILSDLMVHGGIVVISEERRDQVVQCLEDLIVTIEGVDDRDTEDEEGEE